jgi:hypothetical protein
MRDDWYGEAPMLRSLLRAVALSGWFVAMCACLLPRARAAVTLQATVGFENTFRADSWTPVHVRLRGQSQSGSGRLELRIRTRWATQVYHTPVRLGGGATDQVHWLYAPLPLTTGPGEETAVNLVVDGRVIATQRIDRAVPLADGDQPVLVCLTQDLAGYAHLNGQVLGLDHTPAQSRYPYRQYMPNQMHVPGISQRASGLRVLHPTANTLPDRAVGYRGVDAVVLGNVQPDALTDAQWDALTRWVRDGGSLIVSGGSDAARLRVGALANVLPIAIRDVPQIPNLDALASFAGSAPPVASVPVAAGALQPGARAVCGQAGLPLVSARRAGLGTVVMTAFDLASPQVRQWTGQTRLWRALFGLCRREQQLADAIRQPARMRYAYGSNGGLLDAVTGSQSEHAPGLGFIAIYLAAYIICLVPLNYLLLRRRDKRELAWITVPVIIILFSTGAYALGYSMKGGRVVMRYCTIVESSAGAGTFAATTLLGVFSPMQTRYDISVPDPHAVAEETRQQSYGMPRDASAIEIERGDRTIIRDAPIDMWDSRAFTFDSEVRPGGSVDATVARAGAHRLVVSVTNRTPLALTDCSIASIGGGESVGSLAPGETRRVSVDIPTGNSPTSTIIRQLAPRSGESSDAMEIRNRLLAEVNSTDEPTTRLAPMVFAGWFEGNISGVTIDGVRPLVDGAGLLVVHLPAPGGGIALPGRVPWHAIRVPQAPRAAARAYIAYNDSRAYNQLAYSQAARGDLKSAMDCANRALRAAPNDGGILDTVGEMHQRRKEYPAAIRFYTRALAHQSGGGLTETHAKLGETLVVVGRKAEGIPHLRRAARDMSSPWGERARNKLKQIGAMPQGPLGTRP